MVRDESPQVSIPVRGGWGISSPVMKTVIPHVEFVHCRAASSCAPGFTPLS